MSQQFTTMQEQYEAMLAQARQQYDGMFAQAQERQMEMHQWQIQVQHSNEQLQGEVRRLQDYKKRQTQYIVSLVFNT
jgi:F0F1-type ATP synthase membrane subunit b/b'